MLCKMFWKMLSGTRVLQQDVAPHHLLPAICTKNVDIMLVLVLVSRESCTWHPASPANLNKTLPIPFFFTLVPHNMEI